MAYVAVRGGREAIENAARLLEYQRLNDKTDPIEVRQIREQMYFAVDRVMGEGSLYAPDLAALAIKQAAGDIFEASFLIRAYRATLPRVACTFPARTEKMRTIRRISSAFKDVPGGQILGPTPDYTLRLLRFELMEEDSDSFQDKARELLEDSLGVQPLPETFPKVVELLRKEGLLQERHKKAQTAPFDVTREALTFPPDRSASLQIMARGETGGMLALAYSNMRGYGTVHPTIGELRVGYLPVQVKNPVNGRLETLGEVKVTEAEVIAHIEKSVEGPCFTLGYGLVFGHNETKAIAMAVLDRATQQGTGRSPSEDQEFVLSHIDGIESMGFCNHYKLPHYVTFQSSLDRLRTALENHGKDPEKGK